MSQVSPLKENEVSYWQMSSQIEAGRTEVLQQVAQGESLEVILNTLCKNSEIYNPEMKTSVLVLNEATSTLHPCASVSLPKHYCDALDGVVIGVAVGSCGTAAYLKRTVIVDDINTAPYWTAYKDLALSVGLQACWSVPIIGANGRCFGTFASYYEYPKSPSEEDVHYIEACASLAAVVFENNLAKEKLLKANQMLSKTVDQRNEELQNAINDLALMVNQQKIDSKLNVNLEKSATTKMLLLGFAHEINTPLGVAVTSNSYVHGLVSELQDGIQKATLTKSSVLDKLDAALQSIELSQSNLRKASELISKFRSIDDSVSSFDNSSFVILPFLQELDGLFNFDERQLDFSYEVNDSLTMHSKLAMFQILNELIENSLLHGFDEGDKGHICINISNNNDEILIVYQDDGKGLEGDNKTSIFEPFYSSKRQSGQLGLGLSMVQNTLSSIYKGTIENVDAPVGIRFDIHIPIAE